MTLFVVGAGAIGTFLSVRLGATCLVRDAETRQALAATPFRLRGAVDEAREVTVGVLGEASLPGGATVIVTTKVTDLQEALVPLVATLPDDGTIVLAQNGIGVLDAARSWVGPRKMARAACWMGIRAEGRGHAIVAGVHSLVLAAGSPDAGPATLALETACRAAGIPALVEARVEALEWKKALWNLAVNGVATLTDSPNGVVLDDPGVRTLAEGLLAEAIAVAAAEGIVLGDEDRARVFASLAVTRDNINATLQDVRNGRPTEMPFLNAQVRDLGERHGVATPLNRAVAALVDALARRRSNH